MLFVSSHVKDTAAALALGTAFDDGRKEIAGRVARFPARLL